MAAQSRKSEEFIAENGTTTFTQESIWNGSEWLLLDTTAYEYDEQQRVVKTTHGNGRFSTTAWMCCGPLRETDEDGIVTTYAYDSAHQLTETSRAAVYDGEVCITPETITEYSRDAAGRVLSTTRRVGAMETMESTVYDALGRVTTQVDVLGRITTTAYSADGLTTTRTSPAGATSITTRNADGSTASVGGTGQREQLYVYDLSGNNERVTTKLPDGTILSQSLSNGFGQTSVQVQASTTGYIYTRSEYNAKGQMVKQYQDTGWNTEATAATLYEYDSFGNQAKQTLALSDTPTKDNSPVSEVAYSVESMDDGIYSVITQTRYNAEGVALNTTQKQLISRFSATLSSKSISTDVRGNSSVNWSEYTAPAKVTSYSSIPTSGITAEVVAMDGFTLSQKNHAGITTAASRSYTASGVTMVQVDGRGNATTSVSDVSGRTIRVTDAAGAITTTAYDELHDQPAAITDALGNTSCYKYDAIGRKIAEWGTALQPACFGYDDMDNMTTLRTFRAGTEIISTDPSERTDGDQTTWVFHPATGLELSKTYADGTTEVKTYDAYNRLATETDARGNVKTYSYEHARGLHLGTTYTIVDGTTETVARSFTYNHLGQMTQLVDDAGTRTIGYNIYSERETDSLAVDGDTHLITEQRDNFGRSTGYTYAKNGVVQQTVSTSYGADGRISSSGFLHGGEAKNFGYTYLAGTNLLHVLTKPNGMTLTQTYETTRDLLTGMAYHRGTTLVAQREYTYDILGRPTARNAARNGQIVNDTFAHNTRSELIDALVNGVEYEYAYDNIGNRQQATEGNEVTVYDTNALNQYTAVSENGAATFEPQFDADGNQTLIKTSTGIWSTVYNAENRPVSFTNADTGTVVESEYDYLGRRSVKKVTVNGSVTLHQRYIYRGSLKIASIDLTRSHHPCLWLVLWDPSQPIATRPQAIQIEGTWYTYGLDLTKNVCEVFGASGFIASSYKYTPFGDVSVSGSINQPIQWSSEYYDRIIGLSQFNSRYYNPNIGNWTTRDCLSEAKIIERYKYCKNSPIYNYDHKGYYTILIHGTRIWSERHLNMPSNDPWHKFSTQEEKTKAHKNIISFADAVHQQTNDVWTFSRKNISDIENVFDWGGGNWHQARIAGGISLANHIIRIKNTDPREKINIIAHSHGGNVVMHALDILSKQPCKNRLKVEYVILLGTPHMTATYKDGQHPIYFTSAGQEMIKKGLYSIYSVHDSVQDYWADTKDGLAKSLLPNPDDIVGLNYINSYRSYLENENSEESPKNIIGYDASKEYLYNVATYSKTGISAHGELHDTDIGTVIGKFIKTGSTSLLENLKDRKNPNK